MKLEDLYPENRVLVVKKVEDTENDYLVAGKGVVTGVVSIPTAVKTGDYITLKAEEDGTLVFDFGGQIQESIRLVQRSFGSR